MSKLPTLYSSYQECILDIKIFGQITSTPQLSLEELKESLFEEFKRKKPLPTLEYKRYELSRLVNPDYLINYNKELELQDNEVLVELKDSVSNTQKVDIDSLHKVADNMQDLFSYESNVTSDVRDEIIAKYNLETGEEFKLGVEQSEHIVDSVSEDTELYLSDNEIDSLAESSDDYGLADFNDSLEEEQVIDNTSKQFDLSGIEIDEDEIQYDGEDSYENLDADSDSFTDEGSLSGSEEFSSDVRGSSEHEEGEVIEEENGGSDSDDFDEFDYDFSDEEDDSDGVDSDGDSEDEDFDEYDYDFSDDSDDESDGESDGESDDEDFDEFDYDFSDDSGDSDDESGDLDSSEDESEDEDSDGFDYDFSDDSNDELDDDGESASDESDGDDLDEYDYDFPDDSDDSDDEESVGSDDSGESDDEDFDEYDYDFSDEEESDDSGTVSEDEESSEDEDFDEYDYDFSDEEESNGSEESGVADDSEYFETSDIVETVEDNNPSSFSDTVVEDDVNDFEPEFIPKEKKNKVVETPITPVQVRANSQKFKQEVVDRDSEPKDLREFLRKYPRCEYNFALKYFTKKQINDAIKRGKIIKKGNTLRV